MVAGDMMRIGLIILLLVWLFAVSSHADQQAWVTVEEIDRASCPDDSCGIIGQLMKHEKVTMLEEKEGWARISIYYDAGCKNGKSVFISKGNRSCATVNGIYKGKMAEWVRIADLAHINPEEQLPAPKAKYDLVRLSDDFEDHKDIFADTAQNLISSGRCTTEDFDKIGGWMSSSNYNNKPIYFIYCGGKSITNQVHLDVSSGRVW